MANLTTETQKVLARNWYAAISNNEILNVSKSKKFQDVIAIKVFNPIFKSTGYIWIKFNIKERLMFLQSEVGTHAMKEF
jgi:hypothetical protein